MENLCYAVLSHSQMGLYPLTKTSLHVCQNLLFGLRVFVIWSVEVNERMLTMMALIGCLAMRHLVRASIVRYMCRICICLAEMSTINLSIETSSLTPSAVVPANSDSDVVLCLQLLSKHLRVHVT